VFRESPPISGAGVSQHDAPPEYASWKPTNTFAQASPRKNRQSSADRPQITSADRHAIVEHLRDALSQAKAMELSAGSDLEATAIAGLDFRASLRNLWRLRKARSDDWATIVNKLQMATSNTEFELFTLDMAAAVRMVVQTHLRPDVDNDDVRASTVLLERAGLRPWKCVMDEQA
jgi:hypothetical protein